MKIRYEEECNNIFALKLDHLEKGSRSFEKHIEVSFNSSEEAAHRSY